MTTIRNKFIFLKLHIYLTQSFDAFNTKVIYNKYKGYEKYNVRKGSNIMNIAFFLTPKKELVFQKLKDTMRQAMERMEFHRYSAIPILDDKGEYVGTMTEGDLLWKLKNTKELDFKNTSKITLKEIPMHVKNNPVHIDAEISDLIATSINQNFVPVVDDNNIFIGIIKRSDILTYFHDMLYKKIVVGV